jgi:hypothetical protein
LRHEEPDFYKGLNGFKFALGVSNRSSTNNQFTAKAPEFAFKRLLFADGTEQIFLITLVP